MTKKLELFRMDVVRGDIKLIYQVIMEEHSPAQWDTHYLINTHSVEREDFLAAIQLSHVEAAIGSKIKPGLLV